MNTKQKQDARLHAKLVALATFAWSNELSHKKNTIVRQLPVADFCAGFAT